MEENKNISKEAIYKRIYSFLKRENYSLRIGIHIGQILPTRFYRINQKFYINYKKRKEY